MTLKVKPQINEGNSIKMELEQEVPGVNTTAITGVADITTSVRSIKTTVLVEDGQTLVLGGLIDDQITDVEEKVPFLGDIPVIGRLFRYRSTQKRKQNLMIFLHPVIMRDSETASTYSNSKYKQLRSKQTIYRQEKDNPAVRERPTLPDLKLFLNGEPVAQGQPRRATTVATTKPLPEPAADELAPIAPTTSDATTPAADSNNSQAQQSSSIVTFSEQPALDTTTN